MAIRKNGRLFWPSVESLESRLAPVVGANAVPPAVLPGDGYEAVVKLTTPTPTTASGSLFRTGQGWGFGHHILTVAHNAGQAQDVTFELARGGNAIQIRIRVPAGNPFQVPHPNYNPSLPTDSPNDIAIYRLTDQEPGFEQADRLLVAPFGAQPFELYKGTNEVGQTFALVGYGLTGTGTAGAGPGTVGTKRSGSNRFDADGSIYRSEVQRVVFGGAGNFTVSFSGVASGNIPGANATAAQFLAALQNIPALAGNVAVQAVAGSPGHWWLTFINGLANTNVSQMASNVVGVAISTVLDGDLPGVADATLLAFDFDNNSALNDALGVLYGIKNLGLGANESLTSFGDSGGPALINNRIAGIQQSSGTLNFPPTVPPQSIPDWDSVPHNHTFGEVGLVTRVSSHLASFINPTVNPGGKYHLVLDMAQQVLGNDNITESITITARRSGGNLQLIVTGPSGQYSGTYFSGPAANIASLTIRGSDDHETIKIKGDLGVGPIRIMGRDGNDTIHGGPKADLLFGEAGNDVVEGGDGDDTIIGGEGSDTLKGESDHDRLIGDGIDMSAFDTSGTIDLLPGGEADVLIGGKGRDTLNGQGGNDKAYGDLKDQFDSGGGKDSIDGGEGEDTIFGGAGDDDLRGGEGDHPDIIAGNDGNDRIDGGKGPDKLYGDFADSLRRGGTDQILGQLGNDTIRGGHKRDIIEGGRGSDILYGDDGAAIGIGYDLVYGDDKDNTSLGEDDTIYGGPGGDTVYGGPASDIIIGDHPFISLYYNDMLYGGPGDDFIDGTKGNDFLNGEDDNDTLHGGEGSDSISGDQGNDDLYDSLSGRDTLFGGAGDDYIKAHRGRDVLDGGSDYDTLDAKDDEGGDVLKNWEGADYDLDSKGKPIDEI